MKIASASVFSEAAPALPIWNTMRNPNAFLRKLSLNAEENWHQNRGAKRRDVMRCSDMALAFPIGPDGLPQLSWLRIASFGAVNLHEQAFRLGVLDAVHQPPAFMHVADRLCERDAGLDEHSNSHCQVTLDGDVGWKKDDCHCDHRERDDERRVRKGDPRPGVVFGVRIHSSLLFLKG